ncbi:uncharacterized protein LOC9644181 isoform X2 [Selaginella moellendorffii]|uniref:uncharacterized protein LOC9644181 isoform X2 n=1 Tax=Selaginella moellendorffii TaxID=88036 RepID=UPI000D1CA01D|nr:uncharacterized protein LOC9644181 isoform X2 [Selaginella moellendorffii]|eukprot:XP_024544476.1 uncharacterized protein LOC9644181 isoform X2 [Selaginella moellendorffii]
MEAMLVSDSFGTGGVLFKLWRTGGHRHRRKINTPKLSKSHLASCAEKSPRNGTTDADVSEARALCEYIAEVGYLFYPPANDHTLFSFVSISAWETCPLRSVKGSENPFRRLLRLRVILWWSLLGSCWATTLVLAMEMTRLGSRCRCFGSAFVAAKACACAWMPLLLIDRANLSWRTAPRACAALPGAPLLWYHGFSSFDFFPLWMIRVFPERQKGCSSRRGGGRRRVQRGMVAEGGSALHGGRKGSGASLAVGLDDVPHILDLVSKLTENDYFFYLPVTNLGWNLRAAVATYRRLGDIVEEEYSQLEGDRNALPEVPPAYPCDEVTTSPLRVSEARLLLRGIRSNQLLRSLLLHRPPHSTLPHYYTIVNASAHARLWLGRYDLPVYYDHSLTYGQLCTRGAASAEEEALNGGFLVERGPSLVETALRHNTLNHMWKEGPTAYEKLVHMRPEDYEPLPEEAVAQDEMLWKALQQLRHAVVATPSYAWGHALSTAVFMYAKHFPLEPEAKRKFLFRHGVPKHFGTLQVFDTIRKLSEPLESVALKERTFA